MKEMLNPTDADLLLRLQEGKVVLTPTQGASMRPFIEGGRDKALVRKQEVINIGDIVMVPYGDMVILHRVYAIEGSRLVLMGDGNLKGNEVVEKSAVLGTAIEIIGPDGRCRKPHKAWLWRHTLPIRKYLLKIYKKWNKLMKKI